MHDHEFFQLVVFNKINIDVRRIFAALPVSFRVSIGNEIDPGILRPYGSSYDSAASAAALAMFLNSGYQAVKEVFPDTQVVLHVGCNANDLFWANKSGGGIWFFDLMEQYGVKAQMLYSQKSSGRCIVFITGANAERTFAD